MAKFNAAIAADCSGLDSLNLDSLNLDSLNLDSPNLDCPGPGSRCALGFDWTAGRCWPGAAAAGRRYALNRRALDRPSDNEYCAWHGRASSDWTLTTY